MWGPGCHASRLWGSCLMMYRWQPSASAACWCARTRTKHAASGPISFRERCHQLQRSGHPQTGAAGSCKGTHASLHPFSILLGLLQPWTTRCCGSSCRAQRLIWVRPAQPDGATCINQGPPAAAACLHTSTVSVPACSLVKVPDKKMSCAQLLAQRCGAQPASPWHICVCPCT